MTFRVGQKVVCILRHPNPFPDAIYPDLGPVYTIREINEWSYGTLVMLNEIDNSHLVGKLGRLEPGFIASAFRPIVERKADIGFAHEILRKVSRKDRVPA